MRIRIAYGRVSTASGEQLSALETQLSWLQNQACDLVLSDVESGRNVDRPDYQRMRALIEAGRVSEVVATRLDRLGRLASECDAFIELCDRSQTAVTTRDDGRLSMATPEDLLLTRLKSSLAQGESMKISERIRKAREQGKRDGRPMKKPCFGYRLSRDRKKLELDPEQAPVARELLARLKHHGWRMQPALNEFRGSIPLNSVRAIRSWLLNPTIRGAIAYEQVKNHEFKEVLWDQHEALLSHEDFAEMQAVIDRNRRLWGRHGSKMLRALTSICVCAECGKRMNYIPGRTHLSLRCKGELCSQFYKSTREEKILRYVTQELAKQAAERLASMAQTAEPPEVETLRKQIKALEEQNDPDLLDAIARKKQRLESLQGAPAASPDLVRKIADPRWFDTLTYNELTLVLHQVVERVVITKQAPTAVILKP
jgi:DNA invertase Pin-like site-specific DNA recombinase